MRVVGGGGVAGNMWDSPFKKKNRNGERKNERKSRGSSAVLQSPSAASRSGRANQA